MKPGDHPEFFRLPPPPGRSRESTIVLDRQGRFWHDGELVTHTGMARAFASWIDVHPDDGRFILQNGYDWSYFEVEDVPYFVTGIAVRDGGVTLSLSDGSEELLAPESVSVGDSDAVYLRVKNGRFEARLTPADGAEIGVLATLATGGGAFDAGTDGGAFVSPMSLLGTHGYWGYTAILTIQGPTDTGIDDPPRRRQA